MKVTYPRTIVIQEDGLKPVRFTDPGKAAEHWARIKEQEWIEKNKEDKKYQVVIKPGYHRNYISNQLYDDARIRYRKLRRRALHLFRKILEVNS